MSVSIASQTLSHQSLSNLPHADTESDRAVEQKEVWLYSKTSVQMWLVLQFCHALAYAITTNCFCLLQGFYTRKVLVKDTS